MRNSWRLLLTPPLSGARNMAIDQAIAEAVASQHAQPTLRFYRWHPACISLGHAQSVDLIDLDRCTAFGWDIVRRTTGGRAILHTNELTYSISAPRNDPAVAGGVLESYRNLSRGLQCGLQYAGIQTDRAGAPSAAAIRAQSAACFDTASDYELTINGRKLIGSAQKRSRQIILQHGSLPLHGDITRLADGLALSGAERQHMKIELRSRATTVADALGQPVDWETLAYHLQQGIADTLQVSLSHAALTTHEQRRAEQLHAEKFANAAWTYRK